MQIHNMQTPNKSFKIVEKFLNGTNKLDLRW